MMTIRVKPLANGEVEIRFVPDAPKPPRMTQVEDIEGLVQRPSMLSLEKKAAEVLRPFLQNGQRSARECEEFLKDAGFKIEEMNMTRVRKNAGISFVFRERKGWWFLPSNTVVNTSALSPAW
jgi:hypothetical protein